MTNFLQDPTFLLKVNRHHVKEYWAAIMVLDFETEKPIARLEGKVVSGNMSVAANSPTRKTGSLRVVFDETTYNLTDVTNLIAIDKKISLSVGMTNPFYHDPRYKEYGDILWFKQGVFIITKANSQNAVGSCQVSMNFIDKMGYLNGICGGTLPAAVSLHDRIIIDKDDNVTTEYPLISQIIREVVHHFGGEHYSRISVEDVPDVGRIVVKFMGDTPIQFATDDTQMPPVRLPGGSFVIGDPPIENFSDVYYKGDVVGYKETPLTYPGELIMKAGSTVTQVLDQLKNTLGNYEYFYDPEGIFHFRKIQNYQATGNTPLNLDENEVKENREFQSLYFPRFHKGQFLNEFVDTDLVTSVSFNPNYANIKNDFVCWGTRQPPSKSKSKGKQPPHMVRYHLAIDQKPQNIAKPLPLLPAVPKEDPNYDKVKAENELRQMYLDTVGKNYSLCHKDIYAVLDLNDVTIRYQLAGTLLNTAEKWGDNVAPALDDVFSELGESYWFNWREELYRRALLAFGSSTEGSYYDAELMAEWRNLYDPTSTINKKGAKSFQSLWESKFGSGAKKVAWYGYTPDVLLNPEKIRYWLDFIDDSATVGKYSVKRIGRRTYTQENNKISQVFGREINDIVFIENPGGSASIDEWDALRDKIGYYSSIGQTYALLTKDQMKYFEETTCLGTCYEDVRAALYQHLIYNSSVSITSLPIFYLDVNHIVKLNFPDQGIQGDYVINQISWQLGNTGTMNLSLQEAIVVV